MELRHTWTKHNWNRTFQLHDFWMTWTFRFKFWKTLKFPMTFLLVNGFYFILWSNIILLGFCWCILLWPGPLYDLYLGEAILFLKKLILAITSKLVSGFSSYLDTISVGNRNFPLIYTFMILTSEWPWFSLYFTTFSVTDVYCGGVNHL